jgi:PAS domain S-box-containing protein
MNPEKSPPSLDANEEVSALIATLHKTGQRLEELTEGEVDTVADRDGRTFLLRGAQEQLRHSEAAKQAAILNALPAHIALLDTQGIIVAVNEAWRRFGSAHAIQGPGYKNGLNYLEICDGARGDGSSEAHQVARGIRSVLGGRVKSFSIEYPCHSPTEQRWFLLTVIPLADGRPNGAVVMHLDITERRRTQVALAQSEDGLHRAQLMAKLAHVITGPDGSFEQWSETLPRLVGVEPAQLPRTTRAWLDIVHPDDQSLFRGTAVEASVKKLRVELEYRLHRADGEWINVRQTMEPIKAGATSGSRWFNTLQDVTAQRQTEESLRASESRFRRLSETLEQRVAERTGQLKSVNEELESFSYSVSHDLRAPLRHIAGFAAMLQQRAGAALDAEASRHVSTIVEAAARMSRLVEDLLGFSRMGRAEMLQTRVDLNEVVRDVLHEVQLQASGRRINWTNHPLPSVAGDRAMLRLAFQNLVANAVKYTAPREVAEIEIGARPSVNGERVVYVRDNGVGFDMAYVDKLFGVFQRLHAAEQFEGTGIGLANVRRIVHRHGGRTWAEGAVDCGATFFISLPAHERTDTAC